MRTRKTHILLAVVAFSFTGVFAQDYGIYHLHTFVFSLLEKK